MKGREGEMGREKEVIKREEGRSREEGGGIENRTRIMEKVRKRGMEEVGGWKERVGRGEEREKRMDE